MIHFLEKYDCILTLLQESSGLLSLEKFHCWEMWQRTREQMMNCRAGKPWPFVRTSRGHLSQGRAGHFSCRQAHSSLPHFFHIFIQKPLSLWGLSGSSVILAILYIPFPCFVFFLPRMYHYLTFFVSHFFLYYLSLALICKFRNKTQDMDFFFVCYHILSTQSIVWHIVGIQ